MKKNIILLFCLIVLVGCGGKKVPTFTMDNVEKIKETKTLNEYKSANYQFKVNNKFELINEVATLKDVTTSTKVEVLYYKQAQINKKLEKSETKIIKEELSNANIKTTTFTSKIEKYRGAEVIKIEYKYEFSKQKNQVLTYLLPTKQGLVRLNYIVIDDNNLYIDNVKEILRTLY